MNNKLITIILSLIWGIGIACFLKNLFTNGETIIIKLPDI